MVSCHRHSASRASPATGRSPYPATTDPRPHAPVLLGSTPIGYDANGNMVSDGARTLSWDAANRLAEVTAGGLATSFAYGPDGTRVKKSSSLSETVYLTADVEVDTALAGPTAYTRYPHMGERPVAGKAREAECRWHEARRRTPGSCRRQRAPGG